MTQSGLSDFSSPGDADDGTRDSMETEREDMAAQEAAVVAGGGRDTSATWSTSTRRSSRNRPGPSS